MLEKFSLFHRLMFRGSLDLSDGLMVTAIAIMIFAFIPGAVGVMEGTYAATFHLLSLDPATGTSVQIFRRIRTLLWAGIGFAYISWQHRRHDSKHV
ncbi:MAG: hypothetical protein HQM15_09425 [Deltaproteobacteria bacterium]|nr:hypothetical protein [Deltaproteobacteria bacterium]